MNIALISPYHGGSHRAWAEGFQQASRHHVVIFSLPARFWKWRMHGGAVTLVREFLAHPTQFDLILATDMLDLTTFLALTREKTAVSALYLHENQLTYPLPADTDSGPMRRQHGERDLHYVFINYASMLAADHIFFNSRFHQESLLTALPKFLRRFPDHSEVNTVAEIREKCEVLPVGINLKRLEIGDWRLPTLTQSPISNPQSPLILWNQRWEYDKNPEAFLAVLYQLADEGVPFRVALCGEHFGKRPFLHSQITQKLGSRLIHLGYADDDHYRQLLWQADITLSTAHHEFFGISIIEAIYTHTFPLLPRRLSYPELIPEPFHRHCLYKKQPELLQKLRRALANPAALKPIAQELATAVSRYDWSHLAPLYDSRLEAAGRSHQLVDRSEKK